AQRLDQLVDLARVGDPDRVGDAHAMHADLIDSAVDRQQVYQVGSKAVLAAKTHLQPLALDVLDHLQGLIDDVGDVLAVGKLAQIAARPKNHVYPIHPRVDGKFRIVHMTANMGQDLRLQPQLG